MNITSYFSRSGIRLRDFVLFQEVTKTSIHNIPKLAQTRWLSREKVMSASIQQNDALVLYIRTERRQNTVDTASTIHEPLVNRGRKHMLLFRKYYLQKVNTMKIEFQ